MIQGRESQSCLPPSKPRHLVALRATSPGRRGSWQTIYGTHAVRLRSPRVTDTAVAVRRRSSGATSNAGGRSGRCSRSDSVPGNPDARAPPPRNRQRVKARSPPCPATAQRPQRRRWCLGRRGAVPRSCKKSPTCSLCLGRFPVGLPSSGRGSGRRTPGGHGSSSD
jgi:hypothetical protein